MSFRQGAHTISACQISFVIPVLNEEARLALLLEPLRGEFPDAQLIVVDGGSVDATVSIALRHAHVVLTCEPGRAAQMNLGAAAASGDWLLFLHADTRPLFDASTLLARLEQTPAWGFCQVTLEGRPRALRLISWFMNRRSRLTGIATGDQLLIIRRREFEKIGGYPSQPLMEDVEICTRLSRDHPPRALDLRVASSGRRWEEQGVVATVLRMWMLRAAYWLGVSPLRLHQHYYGARALKAEASSASGSHTTGGDPR